MLSCYWQQTKGIFLCFFFHIFGFFVIFIESTGEKKKNWTRTNGEWKKKLKYTNDPKSTSGATQNMIATAGNINRIKSEVRSNQISKLSQSQKLRLRDQNLKYLWYNFEYLMWFSYNLYIDLFRFETKIGQN